MRDAASWRCKIVELFALCRSELQAHLICHKIGQHQFSQCAVTVQRRDAENSYVLSEQSVDERGHGTPLGQHDKPSENDHHEHDRPKPISFSRPHEPPKFEKKRQSKLLQQQIFNPFELSDRYQPKIVTSTRSGEHGRRPELGVSFCLNWRPRFHRPGYVRSRQSVAESP
jgi:hypothetical protein